MTPTLNRTIAYFGLPSSFTHQAGLLHFGDRCEFCSYETIADVFNAVEQGQAAFGVVPIENSNEGAVTHTLDMFIDSPASINAEIYLDIHQNLMSRYLPETISRIYSHPIAFAQCRKWLAANMKGVEQINVSSTTRAAELAAGEAGAAAVGSELAADMYGLSVIGKAIEDYPENKTRFLVIGLSKAERSERNKTSILFSIKDHAGALYDALQPFKAGNINLTKIESRPSKKKAWEYYFFVDMEGHPEDEFIAGALTELGKHCVFVKVLGSYANATER